MRGGLERVKGQHSSPARLAFKLAASREKRKRKKKWQNTGVLGWRGLEDQTHLDLLPAVAYASARACLLIRVFFFLKVVLGEWIFDCLFFFFLRCCAMLCHGVVLSCLLPQSLIFSFLIRGGRCCCYFFALLAASSSTSIAFPSYFFFWLFLIIAPFTQQKTPTH